MQERQYVLSRVNASYNVEALGNNFEATFDLVETTFDVVAKKRQQCLNLNQLTYLLCSTRLS